jgi:hypothetical protein
MIRIYAHSPPARNQQVASGQWSVISGNGCRKTVDLLQKLQHRQKLIKKKQNLNTHSVAKQTA